MNPDSKAFALERETVLAMVGIYCRDRHGGGAALCEECRRLIEYAEARLVKCRYGGRKPVCSQCPTHCYKPEMRARIREVMKYAGPRMLKAHPLLAIRHLAHKVTRRPRRAERASP